MRIVGDVHGKIIQYFALVKDVKESIQIGDLGFRYDSLSELDPSKHKVLAGNHDNYATSYVNGIKTFCNQTEHFLGDYGMYRDMFYLRGGLSIDKLQRKQGINWWEDEQLDYTTMCKALNYYNKVKPEIVLSHECPSTVIKYISSVPDSLLEQRFRCRLPSSTAQLLQEMFNLHKPKLWVFGHYHKDKTFSIDGTKFQCLGKLSYTDI